MRRPFILAGAVGAMLVGSLVVGCKREQPQPAGTQPAAMKVRLLLNWFPEAEHGGYFAALADNLYEQAGVQVEILPGGPGASVVARVATSAVDFGVENADHVVLARAQGAPVVAVMAPIQVHPRCIMVHADAGITDLRQLRDLTLAMNAGGAFSHFLRHTVPLENVRIVPYAGNVSHFLSDRSVAQQAYTFSEPYEARKAGAEVRVLPLADIGFNPYTSCLITSEKMVREHPEIVRAVVQASVRGWQQYLHEPARAHEIIARRNPQMEPGALAFGQQALQPLVLDEAARQHGIGTMSADRWRTLCRQLAETGLIASDKTSPADCFRVDFLPPAPQSHASGRLP